MKLLNQGDIHVRTQLISLGPALLLTLILTAFFTYTRLHDLRTEINQTGQLIANQLAPASEYALQNHNLGQLGELLQATLETAKVRFLEVRDTENRLLVYVEQAQPASNDQLQVFQAPVMGNQAVTLGRVVVGISSDDFNSRQQEILAKAGVIGLLALLLTFLLARRLAMSLSRPIAAMGAAVHSLQSGDYGQELPVNDDGELGTLARHINALASALETASREQRLAIEQLTLAREEAEQANRAKSEFLAMMSHELRTPMNGVLGMLQLLETTEMNSEQAEYTALATESTEHLLKVINDILDFSRIERDALELERIPFDLGELLQSSVQVFLHSAQQRNLSLSLEIQPGLENMETQGDPTRIRQILVNLIGNALKFTEHGGIRVEAHWQALDDQVLWFTCAVHDSGIGIPAERLQHMFDAFQQADNSISRRYGGTGLGLPIARTLAERMGGTLRAESGDQGSVFTLEIPLPFVPRQARVDQRDAQQQSQGAGELVLLVEDNPVNQTVIEAMLRSLGYRVQLAGDGAIAVQAVCDTHFDLILMDCRLPHMDGYEATRRIRQLAQGRLIPIIALTANALQGDRELCLRAGMDDYLAKPFKRLDLQHLLERWLRQRANATERAAMAERQAWMAPPTFGE